jgi:hypothetical protein
MAKMRRREGEGQLASWECGNGEKARRMPGKEGDRKEVEGMMEMDDVSNTSAARNELPQSRAVKQQRSRGEVEEIRENSNSPMTLPNGWREGGREEGKELDARALERRRSGSY